MNVLLLNLNFWSNLTCFSVTKQYVHSPFIGCGCDTTAASATTFCSTRADSISAVLRRWPDTLTMSSIRPVIQIYPSLSLRAPVRNYSIILWSKAFNTYQCPESSFKFLYPELYWWNWWHIHIFINSETLIFLLWSTDTSTGNLILRSHPKYPSSVPVMLNNKQGSN